MNFLLYFVFLVFVGVYIGYLSYLASLILGWLDSSLRVVFSFSDSPRGVEKKEKLISVYLTIAAILIALRGVSDEYLPQFVLVFSVFFVSIIYYFLSLGSNKKKRVVVLSGFMASFHFTIIFVTTLIHFRGHYSSYPLIFFGLLILATVSLSLLWPLDDELEEDEYMLY